MRKQVQLIRRGHLTHRMDERLRSFDYIISHLSNEKRNYIYNDWKILNRTTNLWR
uniref:Uncharacterized protein n=1 Tax=Picea glauca TaxID=3330 RepID=A0A101LY86_PICGL|nr:hypothetical protein ABT39_MTgene5598 [Picea glauca]